MPRSSHTTEAIIIGGGVIGLAIADALAQKHVRVAVLERGLCGRESSWAAAGIIQSGSWHRQDALVQMQRDSVRAYQSFAADLHARTHIDPEFTRCGSIEALLEDQQYRMARSEAKVAARLDKDYGCRVVELLAPEQVSRREPAITDRLLGGKYNPLTGQVRSPRLLRALHEACRAGGVEIIENCAVTTLKRQANRIVGVQTTDGIRKADHIVLAAGSWSSLLDEQLDSVMPVVPVRGQIALLKMQAAPFTHVIERGRNYLVARRDGHILLGATQEPDVGYDKSVTAGGIGCLLQHGVRLVPALAEATLVQSWAGLRPGTPDGRPYIGPVPGFTGLLAATGHFRSGLTMAPVTAAVITDLIVNDKCGYDMARCLPGREFSKPTPAVAPATAPA